MSSSQALGLLLAFGLTACAGPPSLSPDHTMHPVYEIAIQSIKPETADQYPAVRSAFLAELKKQDGVEKDWTLESFFTMPEPDVTNVLVGITRWRSMADFQAASAALGQTPLAGSLFSKVDMRAFVQVYPVRTADFKLEDYITGRDNVLEVAVRTPKEGVSDGDYEAAREAFFGLVRNQPGYLFDQEFTDDSNARIVLIGWETTEAFQQALGALQTEPAMGTFFSMIDVQAYQAARLQ